MIRNKAVVGFVAALALGQSHKRLDYTGVCVVDSVHIPCRTVRFNESGFGQGFGFEGLMQSASVEAVDSNGNQSNTRSTDWQQFCLFPHRTRKITELLLRDHAVYIDHIRQLYEVDQGEPHKGPPYWQEDDPQCSYAKSRGGPFTARMPDSNIAGIAVVGYRGQDNKGVDYEAYFAPSIGCEMMLFREVKRGILGWRIAQYERVVDSYQIGPPARSLFEIPGGYKPVPSL